MFAIVTYLIIGSIAGLLSGLLGIGGGMIVVPTLIWVFKHYAIAPDVNVHLAAGSSLASIAFIAFAAAQAHYRRHTIVWPILWRIIPSVLLGSVIGAFTLRYIPSQLLSISFGCFALITAYRMAFISVKPQEHRHLPRLGKLSTIGVGVGVLSGLLGIGGGAVMVPFFSRYHIRMRNAAGTSISASFPIALVGTITLLLTTHDATTHIPFSTGYVYWPATLSIALSSILIAPFGVRLAQRLPNLRLKRIFAVVLIMIGSEMIIPPLFHFIKSVVS